jgi:hypothetical protein
MSLLMLLMQPALPGEVESKAPKPKRCCAGEVTCGAP